MQKKMKKHFWRNRAPWFVFTVLCTVAFILCLTFAGSRNQHTNLTIEEIRKKKRAPPPKDYKPGPNFVPENERPGSDVSAID